MKPLVLLFVGLLLLSVVGCGGGSGNGGGGGTGGNISGQVLWLPTGSPPLPAATVQIGNTTVQTDDGGTFSIEAQSGTSSLLVLYTPSGGSTVSFRFDIPAITGDADVGTLWIGPEKITVTGKVISSATNAPVTAATVSFGGKIGTTNASGVFSLTDVAYSSQNSGAFLGIEGTVTADGFLAQTFFPENLPSGGLATFADIAITPLSSNEPPTTPANILGQITPVDKAPGTIATLLLNGTAVRQFTVGSDGGYRFFVVPGNYVIQLQNPINGMSASSLNANLAAANEVIRQDVVLH